jgi:NADH-quinone oxidoreductase subunit J
MSSEIFFIVLTALTLASAIMVVSFKSPVNSALSLVLCLVSIAGHFALLGANFLAMIQIALYAGAIVVLVLFVIMLLNLSEPLKFEVRYITWGSIVILFSTLIIIAASKLSLLDIPSFSKSEPLIGSAENLGIRLFTEYLWQFELASLLILSAVVSVVMIAGKKNSLKKESK